MRCVTKNRKGRSNKDVANQFEISVSTHCIWKKHKENFSGVVKPTLTPVNPLTIRGGRKRGPGTVNFHLIAIEITLPTYYEISIIFT